MAEIDVKQLSAESKQLPWWRRSFYLVMVGGAILVATVLVFVAMQLYRNSDAMRLDLSRPGYQAVRDQVGRDHDISSFSPTGPINSSALDEFRRKYDESLKRINGVDAFRGDALSDDALTLPNISP